MPEENGIENAGRLKAEENPEKRKTVLLQLFHDKFDPQKKKEILEIESGEDILSDFMDLLASGRGQYAVLENFITNVLAGKFSGKQLAPMYPLIEEEFFKRFEEYRQLNS